MLSVDLSKIFSKLFYSITEKNGKIDVQMKPFKALREVWTTVEQNHFEIKFGTLEAKSNKIEAAKNLFHSTVEGVIVTGTFQASNKHRLYSFAVAC